MIRSSERKRYAGRGAAAVLKNMFRLLPPILLLAGSVFQASLPIARADTSPADLEKSLVLLKIHWEGVISAPSELGGGQVRDAVDDQCSGWFASSGGDIVTSAYWCLGQNQGKFMLIRDFLTQRNRRDLLDDWRQWTVELPPKPQVRASQPQTTGAVLAGSRDAELIDALPENEGDLALLKVPVENATSALPVANRTPEQGSDVTAVGLSSASDSGQPGLLTRGGKVGADRPVDPVVTPYTEATGSELDSTMLGGPTVNADGQVVGVAALPESDGYLFTRTRDLRAFLERHNVSTAKPAGSKHFPVLAVVLGSVGAVLVISAALFYMLRRRRWAAGRAGSDAAWWDRVGRGN